MKMKRSYHHQSLPWWCVVILISTFTILRCCAQDTSTVTGTAPTTSAPSATPAPTPSPTPSPLPPTDDEDDHPRPKEYAPFDGWYNNFAHPDWGAAETQLVRNVPPSYSDGTFEPTGTDRPNPMTLSLNIFNGTTGKGSYFNRSAFMIFFGQQLVEEVLDGQRPGCPIEFFNMDIPEGHQYHNVEPVRGVMPLLRSRYDQRTGTSPHNPRQQLNEISSFIDGTLMYGPNKAWTDAIRAFKNGFLKEDAYRGPKNGSFPVNNTNRLPFANPPTPREHVLKPINRFNSLGNPRGNENPFLLTLGVLWFRYHNYWARRLKTEHPKWNDEQLFLEARKMVIGVYQKIVAHDWIPGWVKNDKTDGELPPYTGYKPYIHPGITHAFMTSAMRFGHTQVTPGGYRRTADCKFRKGTSFTEEDGELAVRTCNAYWNSQEAVYEYDIEEVILGLSSQVAEREDFTITPDLNGDLFGPLEFSRRDLMALNIQRGRDHGVADYNTVRQFYGLKRIEDFDEIVQNTELTDEDPGLISRVRTLYNNRTDNIDLWVGGMLETDHGPGELFQAILKDQFARLRDGDRFWYENRDNGLFSEAELNLINRTTIRDVIVSCTAINEADLQEDPFFVLSADDFFQQRSNCMQPAQLNVDTPGHLQNCTAREGFDYFKGSEISYPLSVIGLLSTFFVFLGILFWFARQHDKMIEMERNKLKVRATRKTKASPNMAFFTASEWQGKQDKWHDIKLKLDKAKKQVFVQDESGKPLRIIDFMHIAKYRQTLESHLSADKKRKMILIKLPREYDLILKFDDTADRQEFFDGFTTFLSGEPGMESPKATSEAQIFNIATSKEDRKKQLENFFRAVFAHVAKDYDNWDELGMGSDEIRDVLHSEITKFEFMEALGMRSNSTFVESMFNLIDQDDSGSVSFREFLDLIVIFYKGSADDKMRLLFNMYDVDRTGTLSKDEFKNMLKSLVELSNTSLEDSKINDLIVGLCDKAGVDSKRDLAFQDFSKLLQDYESELNYASLDFNIDGMNVPKNISRENAPIRARKTVYKNYSLDREESTRAKRMSVSPVGAGEVKTLQKAYPKSGFEQKMNQIKGYIENYKLHIFWVTLYTFVSIGIFVERAYYYSVEREHAGLRRIAGDGVTVTRGAASGMMFTYSCLLVTMCRNIITRLRETFLHRYIPFDATVAMHKFIALLAFIFTLLHIVGHLINFYHISTQRAPDLNCIFRNFFHATHVLPKFHDWCWLTITGFTGVLLAVQTFMIYIFAIQYSRRNSFRAFWITHNSYIIYFMLMVLHGAGRLVQPAFFHLFFLGPAILFTIDRLISISRKKIEISVVQAELLPSDVTFLEFKRPANFEYMSGQWVRIACTVQGKDEYHPFTLSSAPHEENLSLHIRAVGPWTMQLRRTYNPENVKEHAWPKVLLDGPYGEGHQDWYRFDVAVLVGGGIGVTPFASILKDIAHKSKTGAKITCKKVYFLWVTRTQKHFEWMTEIIREVEKNDNNGLVAVHIFITQFKQKFDIRTTMLYICEKYFQKVSSRSLFTGLESITHFGRPDFDSFMEMLANEHQDTNVFGVFSCGPPPMTSNVEKATKNINKKLANVLFVHHFENF